MINISKMKKKRRLTDFSPNIWSVNRFFRYLKEKISHGHHSGKYWSDAVGKCDRVDMYLIACIGAVLLVLTGILC